MRAAGMKSMVFTFASYNSRAFTSTSPFSNGNSDTSAMRRFTSATVSGETDARVRDMPCREEDERGTTAGLIILNPLISRSKGNDRRTLSTLMCIPVCSETYEATCFTIQFCTGGM